MSGFEREDGRRREEREDLEPGPVDRGAGRDVPTQRLPSRTAPPAQRFSVSPPETSTGFAMMTEAMGFVQAKGGAVDVPRAAAAGVRGSGTSLPHLATIQKSFGKHDVTGVHAHIGGAAAVASERIGAEAYATGNHVAFRSDPDLHTSAHEATHVVQQRAGVSLKGGVGEAGDAYEQHADEVADKVVAGESAEALLDAMAPGLGTAGVQKKDAPPSGQTPAPKVAPGKPAGAKTTTMTFSANYTDVPGKSKNTVASRMSHNALWFAPLSIHQHVPALGVNKMTNGVVAGAGEQTIGSISLQLVDAEPPFTRGSVTPVIRFAKYLNSSFRVKVTHEGKGSTWRATKWAKGFVKEKMQASGDIAKLEQETAAALAAKFKSLENPAVQISVNTNAAKEIGASPPFYFQAFNNPRILMEIEARAAGEKESSFSKTKTEGGSSEVEVESHSDKEVENEDIKRNKVVNEVLSDFVTRVDKSRSKLTSTLTDKVWDTRHVDWRDHEVTESEDVKTEDFDRKLDRYEESGKKSKKNWAAKGKDAIGVIKDVINIIPGVKKIPIIRKVRTWQLDLIEKAAGLFATRGTVNYKDIKETEKADKKTTTTHEGDKNRTIKGSDIRTITRKADFKREVETQSSSNWSRFKTRVETIKDTYKRKKTKESGGGSARVKGTSNQQTTVTISGTTLWKFTKPAIKATVVAGVGEVGSSVFKTPKEPAEAASAGAEASAAQPAEPVPSE